MATKTTDKNTKEELTKKAAPKAAAPKATAPKATATKAAAPKAAATKKTVASATVKKPVAAAEKPVVVQEPAPKVSAKKPAEKVTAKQKETVINLDMKKEPLKLIEKPKDKPQKDPKAKKNILFVCSEASPFAGTGGLGEVMGSLPRAINEGFEGEMSASIILPLYESFPFEERAKLEFICHINVPLAWRNQYCGLFRYVYKGTKYYFVDNEYYFKRPNFYGYYDDGERFAFFSRAVVELIPHLDEKPDVLHCQDWQTALAPIYYKLFYMYREGYGDIKTIFTIHNIEYQGKFAKSIIEDLFGIPYNEYGSIEHGGCINLMKGAIDYSDAISTVSPTYAHEIKDPYYAHGLEEVLQKNHLKLRGILNGVDVEEYNPKTNKALFKNYDAKTIKDKALNKAELRKMLSLPENDNTPIIAIISRLVSHKGLDLVRFAMNELLRHDVQVVLLGKGDADFEAYFAHVQATYSQKFSAVITFNRDLSHKIYAGADMFLMPSKSEPCGLSQMMACRYGTIPIVRETGGLKDSIIDCGNGDNGNGFVFSQYDAQAMIHAIDRAVGLYRDYKDKWDGLVLRAITTDFSWNTSAKEYVKFYNEVLS